MRVLFVTHSFPRRLGDAPGSFLLRLAGALVARGIEVQVVAPSAPGLAPSESIAGVRVDRFRYAPERWETLAYTGTMAEDVRRSVAAKLALLGFFAAERASLLRAVERYGPDVVHAHWWFPNALVATFAGAGHRFPLVTTLHGTDVRIARTRGAAPLLRRVVRRSAELTAVSRWLAEQTRTVLPEAAPLVAPMPAATDLFVPGGERTLDRLLFVGRLNAQKGIERLVRALPHLGRTISLDVVGHGPDERAVRELADALGVTDRVRWHGALPQQRLAELYRAAAVLVVPSTEEGLGLVAVEAQLCETPVVAFRSGGIVDVVEDGTTGLLVDPDATPQELARSVDTVMRDPTRAAAMGREGRRRALATFSPEAVSECYALVYERAVASRG